MIEISAMTYRRWMQEVTKWQTPRSCYRKNLTSFTQENKYPVISFMLKTTLICGAFWCSRLACRSCIPLDSSFTASFTGCTSSCYSNIILALTGSMSNCLFSPQGTSNSVYFFTCLRAPSWSRTVNWSQIPKTSTTLQTMTSNSTANPYIWSNLFTTESQDPRTVDSTWSEFSL